MKRRTTLITAAVALGALLTVGGTLAWFTDTEEATNIVTTGNVDIQWYENDEPIYDKDGHRGVSFGDETPVVPGATLPKKAKIFNEGKNVALIRAKVVPADRISKIITVNYNDSALWLDGEDGWFYYSKVVGVNEFTEPLIDSLSIDSSVGNKVASGSELIAATDIDASDVVLTADAIQAEYINGIDLTNLNKVYSVDVLKKAFPTTDSVASYDTEVE